MSKTLVVENYAVGEDSFDSDVGSWNVTRARRDCEAGKFRLYGFTVTEVIENNSQIEVDADKVAAFAVTDLEKFPPLIFVQENGLIWLIDGHHRIRALHQRGIAECTGYVIEEADAAPYRIFFNGERVAPWMR